MSTVPGHASMLTDALYGPAYLAEMRTSGLPRCGSCMPSARTQGRAALRLRARRCRGWRGAASNAGCSSAATSAICKTCVYEQQCPCPSSETELG